MIVDSIEATFVGFHLCRETALERDLGCLHKVGDGSCSFSEDFSCLRMFLTYMEH